MKKLTLLTLLTCTFLLGACSSGKQTSTTTSTKAETTTSSKKVDLNALDLPQLETNVKENEDVVEIVTTQGNIKAKLFPEIAPKAVENFMTHAKEGYYNGTPFHRVIDEFMIQGGDPKGDGTGGESIWKKGFKVEISNRLYHIRGALAMARSQALDSQGSQFYIVQNDQDVSDGLAIQYYPEKIIEAYKKGGTPQLDGNYTVFGQVIEGMDVVDKIAKAMDRLSQFVMPEANINGTRAYMSLILQAEKYYPGFHQMLSEIEKNEMAQLRQVVVKAQKDGEIRSSCNTDLLVQQIRLIFLGKSYQDALRNGLDVNSLREQLYFIYFLIKNK